MRGADIVTVLKDSYQGYAEDRVPLLAAALAFYAAFALAPMLIIVIEVGAALLGGDGHHHQVRNSILNQLQPAIGKAGADAVAGIVQQTFNRTSGSAFAQTIAWIVFLLAATGFLASVEAALDMIWAAKEKGGILWTLLIRLKSFAILAGAGVIIIAMLFAQMALNMLGNGALTRISEAILSVVVATGSFAVVYKWLPKTAIDWRDVFGGAAVTAVLTIAGQYLIGLYLGRGATTSVYGAAGSFAAILLWLYYSSMIFLVGAEITKAYANRFGSKHRPAPVVKPGTLERRIPA